MTHAEAFAELKRCAQLRMSNLATEIVYTEQFLRDIEIPGTFVARNYAGYAEKLKEQDRQKVVAHQREIETIRQALVFMEEQG